MTEVLFVSFVPRVLSPRFPFTPRFPDTPARRLLLGASLRSPRKTLGTPNATNENWPSATMGPKIPCGRCVLTGHLMSAVNFRWLSEPVSLKETGPALADQARNPPRPHVPSPPPLWPVPSAAFLCGLGVKLHASNPPIPQGDIKVNKGK